MNYKVYVTLGFHINFYHSWRGDTPDEEGFGTDIRVVREIIKTLNRANDAGLKARGYWDTEVYWTSQEILPKHSPDILADIRRRVEAGLDEIVLGPFNNGANHAATANEFRASVAWAIENEWGSVPDGDCLFPKSEVEYGRTVTRLVVHGGMEALAVVHVGILWFC